MDSSSGDVFVLHGELSTLPAEISKIPKAGNLFPSQIRVLSNNSPRQPFQILAYISMAISTDSIIHYTKNFSYLRSILKEGFRIKYCAEPIKLGGKNINGAHPMISFCDVPLSDSERHFNLYGYYGIGLRKKWAVDNGVNPVIYIDPKSSLAESVHLLFNDFKTSSDQFTEDQRQAIVRIKAFSKNNVGEIKIKSKSHENYRFYDEREWRLVPSKEEIGNKALSVRLSDYLPNKDHYNKKLSNFRINFKVSDVSYLIVKKTEEIPKLIGFLRDFYQDKCTAHDRDILISKVCSTEQIIQDY